MTKEVASALLKICKKKEEEVERLYQTGLADQYKAQSVLIMQFQNQE